MSVTGYTKAGADAAIAGAITGQKGVANGLATLDGSGHVPASQLTLDAMEYKGAWNASANTPTLANGTGNQGDFYKVSASGSVNFGAGAITFSVGDSVLYDGSVWQRISSVDAADLSATYAGLTNRVLKTAAYTAANADLIACDTTGGTFAVTLPAASGGKARVAVKWVAGTTGPTIALSGSDHWNTAAGPTTPAQPQLLNQGYIFESDGSSIWTVVSDDLPLSALDSRYSGSVTLPQVSGKANGLLYNGSDESTTLQNIINSMSTFGAGELMLEGVVRADSQITIPQSGSTGTQARMAPIRITSNSAQYGPGSTFSEQTPKTAAPGLDLRYAGRTDAGCSTTIGSTFIANTHAVSGDRGNMVSGPGIPGWCWIFASQPGVGWVVSAAARATSGSVSLQSYGGRIQAPNYGSLEIDHLQFTSGGTSSAPFGISTGPQVKLHDNVFEGMSTKTGTQCDEDPWIFGGPGQGTYLTSALTSGNAYTSVSVAAIPVDVLSGQSFVIGYGTSQTQTVTLSAGATAGSTSLSVTSFTANANYGTNTGIGLGGAQAAAVLTAFSVPSAPFQGYSSRVYGNQFYRCRRIAAGMWTTDLYIDGTNSWMHNCGSTLTQAPSTLSGALTAGSPVTSLSVTALAVPALVGDQIQIDVGPTSEVATVATAAAAGATSVTINSLTPAYSHTTSAKVFNATAGVGAMIESYTDLLNANTIHVQTNRMELIGYNYATRFTGATVNSVICANNFQDPQASPALIAGHRFENGATNNTVIPGLAASVTLIDDRSNNGAQTQLILNPVATSYFPGGFTAGAFSISSGNSPGIFASGLKVSGLFQTPDPATTSFNWTDLSGSTTFLQITGALRTWFFKGPLQIDGNASGGTSLTIGNNSTASSAALTFNAPSGQTNQIQFKRAGTNSWLFYDANSSSFFFRDSVNGVMALELDPGSGTTGKAIFIGSVAAGTWLKSQAGATGSRPSASTAGAGARWFDTTLVKPIWSDGTTWRDATGTAV